jgi:hypothetical protein
LMRPDFVIMRIDSELCAITLGQAHGYCQP